MKGVIGSVLFDGVPRTVTAQGDGTFILSGVVGALDAVQLDRLARDTRSMQYDPRYAGRLRSPVGDFPEGTVLLCEPDRIVLGSRTVDLDGLRSLDTAGLLEWRDADLRVHLVAPLAVEALLANAAVLGRKQTRSDSLRRTREGLGRVWRVSRILMLLAFLAAFVVIVIVVWPLLGSLHANPLEVFQRVVKGGAVAFKALAPTP